MSSRNGRGQNWLAGVAACAAPPLLAFLRGTCRVTLAGGRAVEEHVRGRRPAVGALWHRQVIAAALVFTRIRAAIMVSRSRDGEITARALARTRVRAVRGSSSRGGREALAELVRLVEHGWRAAFAADGPRGPARTLKMGCIVAAQRAGVPLIPMAAAAHPCILARSWDRTIIPLPGARVLVRLGEPIEVPRGIGGETLERIRREVEAIMIRMEEECEQWVRSC